MQMLYIWILAAVVFGVLEGITAQLVSIWFVLGAVAAAVAAACANASKGYELKLSLMQFNA